jgi:hypothetical protein
MEFKKLDVLNALKSKKIDNGPSASDTKLDKQDVIKNLGKACPKPTEKTPDKINQMAIIKKMNGDIAEPAKGIKFESIWTPAKATVKGITQRILTEASLTPNNSPNAFRLDLKSIVLDKMHSKFNINRKNNNVTVELIYPNANGKITVKLNLDGIDDSVYEVGLEDQQYTGNFGASIIKSIDDILNKQAQATPSFGTPSQFANPAVSVSGFSPNWVQGGYSMESDARHFSNLMTLVEQEDPKPEDVDPTADEGGDVPAEDGGDVPTDASGDVNSDSFGADAFSADPGGMDMGGGSVGGGGGMDLGGMGGGGAPDADPNAVNADEGTVGLEDNEEYSTFRDFAVDNFTTTKDGVIDVLSNIVADGVGKQLNNSTQGVKLTASQISNGMQGLNTRPAKEIIDAFLQLYPALDSEFKVSDLETLAEKLEERPSPSDFNQFMEGYIKEMQGQQQSDTDVLQLPNAPQEPMGGAPEAGAGSAPPNEFGDFMDASNELGGVEPTPPEGEIPTEGEDEDVQGTLRKAAELETGAGPELNEFPNV